MPPSSASSRSSSRLREVKSQFSREFLKDEKKEVIVTGEVADLSKKGDFHHARLKGDGKVSVLVTVGADESKVLAKGKTASLRSSDWDFPPFENNEVRLQGGSVVEVK